MPGAAVDAGRYGTGSGHPADGGRRPCQGTTCDGKLRLAAQALRRATPVRAFFGDPRREGDEVSFHFGIDIQAPGGTPVYAVRAGTVYLHQDGLAVRARNGAETFGYWHVVPVVREHQ